MESGGWRGVVTPRTELEGIETIEAIDMIETINNQLLRL